MKMWRRLKRRLSGLAPAYAREALDMGRRYHDTLVRVQRLLPNDPRLQNIRDEYKKAEADLLAIVKGD
jgi:hypothetical protein